VDEERRDRKKIEVVRRSRRTMYKAVGVKAERERERGESRESGLKPKRVYGIA
jgi:hypothetical protein